MNNSIVCAMSLSSKTSRVLAMRTLTPPSLAARCCISSKTGNIRLLKGVRMSPVINLPLPVSYAQERKRSKSWSDGLNDRNPDVKVVKRGLATNAKTDSSSPLKTPLYDMHVESGGKMVPFGGYAMPVQYSDLSIGDSHKWTREKASLFDVSHMLQHEFKGPGAQGLLEMITPASLSSIPNHGSTLSCLLHPDGGIVDDCIITKLAPESFYFVTNAGTREKDVQFLKDSKATWEGKGGESVTWNTLNNGLVALQGPLAAKLLEPLVADIREVDLSKLYFGNSQFIKFRTQSGAETSACLVSRGGYTGEDGFEISVPENEVVSFVKFLMTTAGSESLRWAGLGARDSLRLEAGMCLYGHDLDDTTTPVEGGLSWVIGKDRREAGGFNGSDIILDQLKPASKGGKGVTRRRVGFIVEGSPAREGAEIQDLNGNSIGHITSGCPSPTLGKNIAMGYVQSGHHKSGTELQVVVRGKTRKATVTKMPFVPPKYWKGDTS